MRALLAQIMTISLPLLITSGLTAYIVSSWLLVFARVTGATSYTPRTYWSCGLFGSLRGAALFGGRIARTLALSVFVPLLYVLFFEIAGDAELVRGAIAGLVHAAAVGVALPIVARRAGCSGAPAPGIFGWRLGPVTPLVLLAVYSLYGAAIGYVYVVVAP